VIVCVVSGWAVAVVVPCAGGFSHLLAQHSCQGRACRLAGLGLYLAHLAGSGRQAQLHQLPNQSGVRMFGACGIRFLCILLQEQPFAVTGTAGVSLAVPNP
jgi:hypothetical protein